MLGYFAWNCRVELVICVVLAAAHLLVPDRQRDVAERGRVGLHGAGEARRDVVVSPSRSRAPGAHGGSARAPAAAVRRPAGCGVRFMAVSSWTVSVVLSGGRWRSGAGDLGVGQLGDGGGGAAHGAGGHVGDEVVEEGEAALHRAAARVGVGWRRTRCHQSAMSPQPGRGQRAAELLDREAGAERREVQPVGQRPAGQGADERARRRRRHRHRSGRSPSPAAPGPTPPRRWCESMAMAPSRAVGDDGERHQVGQGVERVVRRCRCGCRPSPRWRWA